jgi:hypothetical protein
MAGTRHYVLGLRSKQLYSVIIDGHVQDNPIRTTASGTLLFDSDGGTSFQILPGDPSAAPWPQGSAGACAGWSAVPNPTRGAVRFRFMLPAAGRMDLDLYSATGRLVRHFRLDHLEAGPHEVWWNGRDVHGALVAAGVYLVRAATRSVVTTGKLIVAR